MYADSNTFISFGPAIRCYSGTWQAHKPSPGYPLLSGVKNQQPNISQHLQKLFLSGYSLLVITPNNGENWSQDQQRLTRD